MDTSAMETIPWEAGEWTTAPAHVEPREEGLTATAREGSDAWRHTSYGFVHDTEHALIAPLDVGRAGQPLRLVRVAPFTDGPAHAGPYLCAPTRPGFTTTFHRWSEGPADAGLH